MKKIFTILLLSASAVHSETLDELLRMAETNNPAIVAARRQMEAAREQTAIAGALPDPRISYGIYLEEVQTRTGPQEQRAGISQTFPIFGKRGLARKAAAHGAETAVARARAVRAATLFELKKNWFELYYLTRALETEQNRHRLFQTLEKTAERAVENGADARDLLDVRITLVRIEDTILTLKEKQTPLVSRINALINRDGVIPIDFPEQLPGSAMPDEQEIQSAFLAGNPAVEEQRALLARRQADQALANRNWIPNVTLGADWIQTGNGGDDPLIANISINLPLWHSKNRAERLSAGLEQAAQENLLQNQINTAQVLLTESYSKRNDAARRAAFYEGELIPPAEQHFELTRTAYENAQADLRELTASEERLLGLRLMLERSRADRAIAYAEIEKLLGGPSE
jgi:outer membrane protein TolC